MNSTARFALFAFMLMSVAFLPAHANEYVLSSVPGPDGRLIDKISVPGIPWKNAFPAPLSLPAATQ